MSDTATSAPVASRFVFLHEVSSLTSGTKVRLLGCIVQYEVMRGRILVEHAYPQNASLVPRIWVDIALVLENTTSTTLATGTWINIIGYTQAPPRGTRKKNAQHMDQTVSLQAVLIWDAGAIRIGNYENVLEEQRRVETHMKSN